MSEFVPWDHARRARVKAKIDKEAARAAARLGASGVVVIAFFDDGEYQHMQDGGSAPMPFKSLYQTMLTAIEINEASGGKDTAIS